MRSNYPAKEANVAPFERIKRVFVASLFQPDGPARGSQSAVLREADFADTARGQVFAAILHRVELSSGVVKPLSLGKPQQWMLPGRRHLRCNVAPGRTAPGFRLSAGYRSDVNLFQLI
jgi:hypothetical protein